MEGFSNAVWSEAIQLKTNNKVIATLGIIDRKLKKQFDLKNQVLYAELEWDTLLKAIKKHKVSFTELPKFPEVRRDLSLLLNKNVMFNDLKQLALKTEKKYLKSVSLFDVFEGEKLGENKKSYALSFVLLDETKTLKDKQIDKIMNNLIRNFKEEFNAQIR
jgi:phenylalanyl-tRNA synthetase beta chain